jgi:hypothetical protein
MAHMIEDEIYKRFTDKNEIIKYANKINEKAIKLDYSRWYA